MIEGIKACGCLPYTELYIWKENAKEWQHSAHRENSYLLMLQFQTQKSSNFESSH